MDLFLVLAICVFGPIIGAALGVLKKPNDKFVFHLLSFAAGVMISIALFELLPLSIQYSGILGCVVGVFTGSLIMFFIDKLIPANHLDIAVSDKTCNLKKTSNSLFLAILLHHLPEGLTIAIGSMIDFNLTLVIAIGLGIHYIPETICVAAPYYYCTKNRMKSFLMASSTFVPILIGFFIGYYFYPLIPNNLFGVIIGVTAGIMAHISAVELIPSSSKRITNHDTIISFIFGIMFVVLLKFIS